MRLFRCAVVYVTTAVVATTLTALPGAAAAVTPPAQAPAPTPHVPTRPFTFVESREAATDHTDPGWLDAQVAVPPETSVEVDVPAAGWANAGPLPLAVARPESGTAPGKVRVRMLSQEHVQALGGRFIAFELLRADGGSAPGSVAVAVDYSGIAKAYGGDFASRLRLVRATPCPAEAVCARPSLRAVNEGSASRVRAAALDVRPDPAVEPAAPAPTAASARRPATRTPCSRSTRPAARRTCS
jgi:hypothetical protein